MFKCYHLVRYGDKNALPRAQALISLPVDCSVFYGTAFVSVAPAGLFADVTSDI